MEIWLSILEGSVAVFGGHVAKIPCRPKPLVCWFNVKPLAYRLNRQTSLFRNMTLLRAWRWSYIYSIAPTSNLFDLSPISLILYPPISLTLYYFLYLFCYYYPKFSFSSLECGVLNYQIIAYHPASPTMSI